MRWSNGRFIQWLIARVWGICDAIVGAAIFGGVPVAYAYYQSLRKAVPQVKGGNVTAPHLAPFPAFVIGLPEPLVIAVLALLFIIAIALLVLSVRRLLRPVVNVEIDRIIHYKDDTAGAWILGSVTLACRGQDCAIPKVRVYGTVHGKEKEAAMSYVDAELNLTIRECFGNHQKIQWRVSPRNEIRELTRQQRLMKGDALRGTFCACFRGDIGASLDLGSTSLSVWDAFGGRHNSEGVGEIYELVPDVGLGAVKAMDFRVSIESLTVDRTNANPTVVADLSIINYGDRAPIDRWNMLYWCNGIKKEAGKQELQHKGWFLQTRAQNDSPIGGTDWGYDESIEIMTKQPLANGERRRGFFWAVLTDSAGIHESDLRTVYLQYQAGGQTFESPSAGANVAIGLVTPKQ